MLAAALSAIDADAIARDVAALVQVPSLTGDEREVMERFATLAAAQGLESEVVEHDLAALRAHPDHPGEEAERTSLFGALATLRGPGSGARRICLNGHLDVVGPGEQPWRRDPFSGAIAEGFVHGRGSADMKGGVVAALHAAGAVARAARDAGGAPLPLEVVVQAVPSEEDGGLGTFAALEADDRFDAALIPEPTAFGLVATQAGALTFTGTIPGVPAHAAVRLEGVSAIDRYVLVHQALQQHERDVNGRPSHPLVDALELPYPLLVGKVRAGAWSSQVPDLLTFEGRVGVRLDETVEQARAGLERAVAGACPEATIAWTGGQFAPGSTDPDDPFLARVADATEAERGVRSPLVGVPYGSDMRLFTARGIPTTMLGPGGLELAHAVDERVAIDDLAQLARIYVRALLGEAAEAEAQSR